LYSLRSLLRALPPTPPLLLFFFFFSSSRAPRHLHSFPTRRSSDLPAGRGIYPGLVAKADVVGFDLYPLQEWCDPARLAEVYDAQDRKSTRLNSSHDQISYAVFCLKKKKKYEEIDKTS